MNLQSILFFIFCFTLTIYLIIDTFGLFLLISGLFIITVMTFHIDNSIKCIKRQKFKNLFYFSNINLLLFSIFRIDGIHDTSESGLESLINIFGFTISRNYYNYELHILIVSTILFILQILIEINLYKKLKKTYNIKI